MIVLLAPSGFGLRLLALTDSSLSSLSLGHKIWHHQHHRHVALSAIYFLSSLCRLRSSARVWVKATWLLAVEAITCRVVSLWNRLKEWTSSVGALVNFWSVNVTSSSWAVRVVNCSTHHISVGWACKHLVLLKHSLLVSRYSWRLNNSSFA